MPWLFRVVRWCLTMPYQILIGPEATTECDDGKRVSTFYLPSGGPISPQPPVVLAITSGFGGVHCIGWSFAFPSSTEQTLCSGVLLSIVITVVPLGIVIFPFLYCTSMGVGLGCPRRRCFCQWLYSTGSSFIFNCSIVLPFLSLTSLPPAAYHVVHWTSLIHIYSPYLPPINCAHHESVAQ